MDIKTFFDDVFFNYRVAGLIVCENKVLLHKFVKDDFWNLPGGRVKAGERSSDALKRELEEEIGFKVRDLKINHIAENFFGFNDKRFHELLIVYKITLNDQDEITKQEEFRSIENNEIIYHWFDKDEVKNIKCLPEIIYHLVNKDGEELEHSFGK